MKKVFVLLIIFLLLGGVWYAFNHSTKKSANSNSTADNTNKTELFNQLIALEKARDNRRLDDVQALRNALSLFNGANGAYPTMLTELQPEFLGEMPKDPATHQLYGYAPDTDRKNYGITYTMEQGAQNIPPGKHLATPGSLAAP